MGSGRARSQRRRGMGSKRTCCFIVSRPMRELISLYLRGEVAQSVRGHGKTGARALARATGWVARRACAEGARAHGTWT